MPILIIQEFQKVGLFQAIETMLIDIKCSTCMASIMQMRRLLSFLLGFNFTGAGQDCSGFQKTLI